MYENFNICKKRISQRNSIKIWSLLIQIQDNWEWPSVLVSFEISNSIISHSYFIASVKKLRRTATLMTMNIKKNTYCKYQTFLFHSHWECIVHSLVLFKNVNLKQTSFNLGQHAWKKKDGWIDYRKYEYPPFLLLLEDILFLSIIYYLV